MEFEWDISKESANIIIKHGVAFTEATTCFTDSNGFQLSDALHSRTEQRLFWVGRSSAGRILTTRFTERGDKVRIIGSAEWRKFRRLYDEATEN